MNSDVKRRILFVDDEPNVLEGLRNLLRKQRHQWDMTFATSGKAALEELAKTPFDVIVSDMRMPGMDGVELLTRVRDTYPQIARLVLSGHAEREAIARVVSVAHQFLSKPSDADTVRVTIERTCQVQSLMQDETLRRAVGTLDRLPSLPDTYFKLVKAAENPNTSMADIAKIVETDAGISIKVLQLVNSAYFGLPQRTDSIAKAVSYLGIENLKSILVAVHVFKANEFPNLGGMTPESLRDEGLMTGSLARKIVRDPKLSDSAFAAGVVHDVGHLVLARDPSRHYGDIVRAAGEQNEGIHVTEKRQMGISHCQVGAYLLGVWGLPFALTETVANHHEPSAVTEGNLDLLAAVHLSDGLLSAVRCGQDPKAPGVLDMAFLQRAGLGADVPKWHAKAREILSGADGGAA